MTRNRETSRTLLHTSATMKDARMLTMHVACTFLQKTNGTRWRLIPTRPVDPNELYPKGINGGHLINILLRDGRAGHADQIVPLEMRWIRGKGWVPLKRELTNAEAAAFCGVARWTWYRISAGLRSKRKAFGLTFFDTLTLLEEMDWIDELAEEVDGKRGKVRGGAHAAHCPDAAHGPGPCPHADFCRADPSHKEACEDTHTSYCRDHAHDGRCEHAPYCTASVNHAGSCKDANDPRRTNRATPASPGWSKKQPRRRNSAYNRCAPDAVATAPPSVEPEQRQTLTEASINGATTDPDERAAMYEAECDQIAVERAAGQFVPKDDEIK